MKRLVTLSSLTLVVACSQSETTTEMPAATPTDAGAVAPIPLATDLCEDPSKVALLPRVDSEVGASSFGKVRREQVERMLAAPTEGPFYMINLIKYRERARYPDGRPTTLTGQEADALYAPIEFITAIGARVVFTADVSEVQTGDGAEWQRVAIVEYPCPLAFFAMISDPDFQARSVHKEAGVERTIVMPSTLLPSSLPPDFMPPASPFPPSGQDPSFEMVHVLRYHTEADYDPAANQPSRSGREAMALYTASASTAVDRVGAYRTATFEVQGVLIGDDRAWDEVRIDHMPSRAGFDAFVMDPSRMAGQLHRDAALEDTYSLITHPTLNTIPGAPAERGAELPPVTADGTGTLCRTDADCPGGSVSKCLIAEGPTGFCTRQGCGAGDCEAPYVCCRECSEMVAALLPFAGSACFPNGGVSRLTGPPVLCTCD